MKQKENNTKNQQIGDLVMFFEKFKKINRPFLSYWKERKDPN